MNEEEKKVIANFKYWIDTNTERGVCYFPDYICAKVLNLIEKQQKEIEELKVNNKKLQDKAKELIYEKQQLTSALLDSTPNDKIKAKMEELDNPLSETFKSLLNAEEPTWSGTIKQFLQSLLEKE